MIRMLARVFWNTDSVDVVECRHCGTTLKSTETEECPACGRNEIACYSV
jgi:rubrerythrin